jgi:membrane protein DedA with SNARE-associated domain
MDSHIAALLLEYRWFILVPLSFVESPVVAFISGTMASMGYFNIFVLGAFFFIKDLLLDGILYYVGHRGVKTAFVHRMLGRFNIEEAHFDEVRRQWESHPMRTMLVGKVSYGIALGFIVAAGAIQMSLKKFFGYGALAAILQYWTLLLLGYFFGTTFASLTGVVGSVQWVLGIGGLLVTVYYVGAWYLRNRVVKNRTL